MVAFNERPSARKTGGGAYAGLLLVYALTPIEPTLLKPRRETSAWFL
jgi:hypothetical protein